MYIWLLCDGRTGGFVGTSPSGILVSKERAGEVSEDLSEIGFNNDAERGPRRLHVQTEVVDGTEPKVRTTVLESGTVRHVETHACPTDAQDPSHIRAMAETQHNDVLTRVTRGELG
jgi:hypothetical protein